MLTGPQGSEHRGEPSYAFHFGYGVYKHMNVNVNVKVECYPECVHASVSVLLRLWRLVNSWRLVK